MQPTNGNFTIGNGNKDLKNLNINNNKDSQFAAGGNDAMAGPHQQKFPQAYRQASDDMDDIPMAMDTSVASSMMGKSGTNSLVNEAVNEDIFGGIFASQPKDTISFEEIKKAASKALNDGVLGGVTIISLTNDLNNQVGGKLWIGGGTVTQVLREIGTILAEEFPKRFNRKINDDDLKYIREVGQSIRDTLNDLQRDDTVMTSADKKNV